VQRIVLKE
jgi:Ca2+-binding EF-hand superfamily protein